MKEQIKQALEKAESRQGYFESKKAHEWLRWQNERIEQLEKALEQIESIKLDITSTQPYLLALTEAKNVARQALGKEE